MTANPQDWQRLLEATQNASAILPDADAVSNQRIQGAAWTYSYAAAGLSDELLSALENYVTRCDSLGQYQSLLAGATKNISEDQAVLHHACRDPQSALYQQMVSSLEALASDLNGTLAGRFKTVVYVGIGGSYLGPKYIEHALSQAGFARSMEVCFLPNIDANSLVRVMEAIDCQSTLFVFVSKSGSTRETMENYQAISAYLTTQGILESDQPAQFMSITTAGSFFDDRTRFSRVFEIDSAVGGRYSLSSVVGMVLMTLCFGLDVAKSFLSGAFDMDQHAKSSSLSQNIPLMMAAIGFWQRSCKGYTSRSIVAYSDALTYFPSFLQQLYGESLGKATLENGDPLFAGSGPLVLGGVGTLLQHSLFQFFHDSPDIVPVQFIAFKQANVPKSGLTNESLNQNCVAQMAALLRRSKERDGVSRPSSILIADQISPYTLGALLSVYENATMFEGFLYGINSFDQPAVELGKQLANQLSDGQSDPLLDAFHSLFK